MAQTPDNAPLFDWLDKAIGKLPSSGQIILNFDGNTVKWETKEIHLGHDRNGDCERTEVRRSGRLIVHRRKIAPVIE